MANVTDEDSIILFDKELLKQIDLSKGDCRLDKFGLSTSNIGDILCMRPLCSDDFEKGYIELLSQLTKTGDITKEMFIKRLKAMKASEGTYYIVVVENTEVGNIVASGTLVIEQKFIHETALRGRVEDIIVDDSCRGKKIGQLLVETLTLLSEHLGCYKTSLECRNKLVSYYQQFGFKFEDGQNYLCKRFFH